MTAYSPMTFFQISESVCDELETTLNDVPPDEIRILSRFQLPIGIGWDPEHWSRFWGWGDNIAKRMKCDFSSAGEVMYVVHVWSQEKAAISTGKTSLNLHSAVVKTGTGKRALAKSEPEDTIESIKGLDGAQCEASNTSLESTLAIMRAWVVNKEAELEAVKETRLKIERMALADAKATQENLSCINLILGVTAASEPSLKTEAIVEHKDTHARTLSVAQVMSRRAKRERNRARKLKAKLGNCLTYSPPAYSGAGASSALGITNNWYTEGVWDEKTKPAPDYGFEEGGDLVTATAAVSALPEASSTGGYLVYPPSAWNLLSPITPIYHCLEKPRTLSNMRVVYIMNEPAEPDVPNLI